jgi:hypothetical protein
MPLAVVENLKPGDEVRQDVLNLNGMLFLSKGTVLIERPIHQLKMCGVETINVQRIGGTIEVLSELKPFVDNHLPLLPSFKTNAVHELI